MALSNLHKSVHGSCKAKFTLSVLLTVFRNTDSILIVWTAYWRTDENTDKIKSAQKSHQYLGILGLMETPILIVTTTSHGVYATTDGNTESILLIVCSWYCQYPILSVNILSVHTDSVNPAYSCLSKDAESKVQSQNHSVFFSWMKFPSFSTYQI